MAQNIIISSGKSSITLSSDGEMYCKRPFYHRVKMYFWKALNEIWKISILAMSVFLQTVLVMAVGIFLGFRDVAWSLSNSLKKDDPLVP